MSKIHMEWKPSASVVRYFLRYMAAPGACFLLLMLFSSPLYAQTVAGMVTHADTALAGATVQVKGKSTATQTDANGRFTIAAAPGATLVISSVGFESQQVEVNNQKSMVIRLTNDSKVMDQVVVVGYGQVRRSDITGSVASISNKDIKTLPVASIEGAMQGRLAGVQIQQSSGQPGAGITIRIRGASSIAGGNDPLFVIDGVPQVNSNVNANSTNGLAALNPNDVESIEVLKDASATSIYGSRAANGVVLVTTKKGRAGQSAVTYDTYLGVQNITKKLDVMNGDEYVAYVKQVYTNMGRAIPAELATAPVANTDWQKQVLRSALQQSHTLGFSGGSDKTQFYSSINYLSQDGIVKKSNYSRGSLRLNLNSELTNRISIQANMFASKGKLNGFSPSDGTPTQQLGKAGVGAILLATPSAPIYNANGTFATPRIYSFSGIDMENPINYVTTSLDQTNVIRIQSGMDLKVKLATGLVNTARVAVVTEDYRRDVYLPKTLIAVTSGVGLGRLTQNNTVDLLAEDFLNYSKTLSTALKMDVLLGASYQTKTIKAMFIQATGFISDDLKEYNIAAASNVTKPVTDIVINTIASAFSRINLNYSDKYLFTASVRGDGASVFSKNKKYGVFPSAAFAWRVSEENFMKQRTDWLTNLKLRASYGLTGNPGIQPYQSLALGNVVNTNQGGGTGLVVGLSPSLPNDNLTWETTAQTNIGIDLGISQDRYRASFDFYNKDTRNLLATVQLPPSAGYSTIIDNVGRVRNRGIEVSLGTTLINKTNIRWDVDGNIAVNHNKVLQTKDNRDLLTAYNAIVRVGQPLGSFYTLKFAGFDANGAQSFVDQNKDGKIDANDNIVIGGAYPSYIFGVTTSLSYKKFSLLATMQGSQGARVNNLFLATLVSNDVAYNHLRNTARFNPKPNIANGDRTSDLYIEDASYIRLKNIRLNYALPLSGKSFLKVLNLYVSGLNVFTITKYSGYDPEVNSFANSNTSQGVDYGAYPASRTFTVGLSASF